MNTLPSIGSKDTYAKEKAGGTPNGAPFLYVFLNVYMVHSCFILLIALFTGGRDKSTSVMAVSA